MAKKYIKEVIVHLVSCSVSWIDLLYMCVHIVLLQHVCACNMSFVRILQDPQEQKKIFAKILKIKF